MKQSQIALGVFSMVTNNIQIRHFEATMILKNDLVAFISSVYTLYWGIFYLLIWLVFHTVLHNTPLLRRRPVLRWQSFPQTALEAGVRWTWTHTDPIVGRLLVYGDVLGRTDKNIKLYTLQHYSGNIPDRAWVNSLVNITRAKRLRMERKAARRFF